mgnify:CR=1 FL=1
MEKKQSFGLRKKDLAVIGALLLLAVSCWLAYRLSYRPPEKQNLAVIMVDGQEVMRLNLLEEKDRIFSLRITGCRYRFKLKIIKSGLFRSPAPITSVKTRDFCRWRGKAQYVCPTVPR